MTTSSSSKPPRPAWSPSSSTSASRPTCAGRGETRACRRSFGKARATSSTIWTWTASCTSTSAPSPRT
eukprot:12447555-Alexandrium_andersonii.AAC.1